MCIALSLNGLLIEIFKNFIGITNLVERFIRLTVIFGKVSVKVFDIRG